MNELSSAEFQLLLESTPHPYLILRPDESFTIAAVNDRYASATETQREAIVGHGLFEIFPDNPDDQTNNGVSDLRASLNRVIADRRQDVMGVQKYDIPLRDGSGGFDVKYWSPVNTPVFNAEGGVAFIFHQVEDVTEFILNRERDSKIAAEKLGKVAARAERMEAEILHRATEVKEANRALKGALIALEQREAELARLNERLKELDRAKTEFFSNISHEFRTPLTLMLAPIEDLLSLPTGTDIALHRQALEVAHRNALRLLKLVNALLDFSRIEAGRTSLNPEPTDLALLTAELASNFRSACQLAGLHLRVDCPPLPVAINVDRSIWEKIVLNLVSNAFKFTFKGEIAVELHAVNKQIELCVSDTGTGIPKEELPHIFERFHRVEGTRGRSFEGSGIGLALVRELVELQGGSLTVESELAHGTRFVARIPMVAVVHANETALRPASTMARSFEQEALSWLPNSPATPPGTETSAIPCTDTAHQGAVLIADDNADMRDYLYQLISKAGYSVQAVSNGREAMSACLSQPPDLILTDVMMPELDGFGMLKALRENPKTAELPIILLSARAGEDARVEGLKAGADDYLIKPFNARELVARI